MTEERHSQNQTQFIIEEPLMEKPPVPVSADGPAVPPSKRRPWPLIIGGVVVVILLVGWVMMRSNGQPAPVEETPETPEASQNLSPLEQRLEAARI